MTIGCKTISTPTKGRRHLLFVACLVVSVLLNSAAAQQMKLLAPGTGWATTAQNFLYWTNDDGRHWADITPDEARPLGSPAANKQAPIQTYHPKWHGILYAVFFLNPAEGWAILGPVSADSDDYQLAHTVDSGKHWAVSDLVYPPLPVSLRDALAGPSAPFFVDPLHGWLQMSFSGNSRPGKLMVTEDGGKTWRWTNGPGETGEMFFLSRQRGWIACFGWSEQLFVTSDGSKSWQTVSVPPPAGVNPVYRRFTSAPVFRDSRNGVLSVYYPGPNFANKVGIYSTANGGETWHLANVISESADTGGAPVALAETALLFPTGSTVRDGVTGSIPLGQGASRMEVHSSERGIRSVSFADRNNGWAIGRWGGLLATSDGGSDWRDITPGPKPLPRKGIVVRNGVVEH
jgi:photosystem II stability/assembly factor-like uncharacterized protein